MTRIISLEAENFKRLKVIAIKPDGNIVQITGANGAGKSSVLDAIYSALVGREATPKQPVRKGQKKAEVELDLGHLKVRRTFTATDEGGHTTSLTVIAADGGKFKSPQSVLDAMCGDLSFDPLAFARMKPLEQFDALRKLVPGVDFDQLDRLDARDYDARTEKNSIARRARTQASTIEIPEAVPGERVDEAALLAEMSNAAQINSRIEDEKRRRGDFVQKINDARADAQHAQARADELRQQANALDAKASEWLNGAEVAEAALRALPPLEQPVDVTVLKQKIEAAQATNKIFALVERRADLIAEAEIAEAASEDLTKAMAERQKQRLEAIAKANIPVDGISFGNKIVLLNGVPFEQASDAEQLKASIGIAAALNPTLRVIRVRDGSLLDEDSMKFLERFAEKNDLQIWIERVDTSGTVGVVLEDGMIKHVAEAAE